MSKPDPAAVAPDRPAPACDAAAWVDLAPMPACAIDASGRIVFANQAMARCLAAEPERLAGAELAAWATGQSALAGLLAQDDEAVGEFGFRAGDADERRLALS